MSSRLADIGGDLLEQRHRGLHLRGIDVLKDLLAHAVGDRTYEVCLLLAVDCQEEKLDAAVVRVRPAFDQAVFFHAVE